MKNLQASAKAWSNVKTVLIWHSGQMLLAEQVLLDTLEEGFCENREH